MKCAICGKEESNVLLMVFDIDFLQDFRIAFTEYIPNNPIMNIQNLLILIL